MIRTIDEIHNTLIFESLDRFNSLKEKISNGTVLENTISEFNLLTYKVDDIPIDFTAGINKIKEGINEVISIISKIPSSYLIDEFLNVGYNFDLSIYFKQVVGWFVSASSTNDYMTTLYTGLLLRYSYLKRVSNKDRELAKEIIYHLFLNTDDNEFEELYQSIDIVVDRFNEDY